MKHRVNTSKKTIFQQLIFFLEPAPKAKRVRREYSEQEQEIILRGHEEDMHPGEIASYLVDRSKEDVRLYLRTCGLGK
jgi:hypothetical protein